MRTLPFIFLLLVSFFLILPLSSSAWTIIPKEFPQGHATVIVHAFCLDTGTEEVHNYAEPRCDIFSQRSWQVRIKNALEQWNNAGSNFFFDSRPAMPDEDPCDPQTGYIYFILTDHTQPNPCQPNRHFNGGWGTYWPSDTGEEWAWIFFNTTAAAHEKPKNRKAIRQSAAQTTFLHELGHAVGLGHPGPNDPHTVMGHNVGRGLYDFLFADDITGIRALYGTRPDAQSIQDAARLPTVVGALEVPSPGLASSGGYPDDQMVGDFGYIWGWVCDADEVVIFVGSSLTWHTGDIHYVDPSSGIGLRYEAPPTLVRPDTLSTCGDIANGFGFAFDWDLARPEPPYPPPPDWIPPDAVVYEVEIFVHVYADGISLGSSKVELIR